jgi:undecaprenyl pyrophosphate synthase
MEEEKPRHRPPGIHLGIIPDGNRRWLKRQLTETSLIEHWFHQLDIFLLEFYHLFKEQRIDSLLKIQHFTIYFLTIENLKREDSTLETIEGILTKLYEHYSNINIPEWICKTIPYSELIPFLERLYNLPNLHLQIIGELYLLPKSFQEILHKWISLFHTTLTSIQRYSIETLDTFLLKNKEDLDVLLFSEFVKEINLQYTQTEDGLYYTILIDTIPEREYSTITMGFAYDPVKDFLKCSCESKLRIQPPIDLVIRTGGDYRTSGFFPYHTLYSEYIFHSKYFPEITLKEIRECLEEYSKRERRFGK